MAAQNKKQMEQETAVARMKELIATLNKASRAYYNENREVMSNYQYDALYDELLSLEEKTGIVLSGSPSETVGYEVLSELTKVTHEYPMLSLDKTKEVPELVSWLNTQEGVLSWKLDGLTTVLTYENGELRQGVTRGNGLVGEDITHNVKVYRNVPKKISYQGKLIVRGESVIRYSDFERINKEIVDIDARYKNPRNLCSGTVRQLNSEICARRNVYFYAFNLVDVGELAELATVQQRFEWLAAQGFDVVEYEMVTAQTLPDAVKSFAQRIEENDVPSDGLVLDYNDIAYGKSLGTTAKFPKDAIAFKWRDEIAKTHLLAVEWSASRTGLINPVAIFEPVELEGTTVSRASLHNVSILESYELGIQDEITVFKANMIIPQIADNLTRSNTLPLPDACPVCGEQTVCRNDHGVKVLVCPNPECPAKQIKAFAHFVSRDAMNVDGLSEATLEKFVQNGFIKDLHDIFHLQEHREAIVELEGFGEKSYNKLMTSVENARIVKMPNFLYSLGIAGIGLSNAKLLCRHFQNNWEQLTTADAESLTEIAGIGEVLAESFVSYFSNPHHQHMLSLLLQEVTFVKEETLAQEELSLAGKTFVITGSLERYANRNALKAEIERLGGKVAGSVSKNTDYLINNDIQSGSSKNKKAKELGIPIITEETFQSMQF